MHVIVRITEFSQKNAILKIKFSNVKFYLLSTSGYGDYNTFLIVFDSKKRNGINYDYLVSIHIGLLRKFASLHFCSWKSKHFLFKL